MFKKYIKDLIERNFLHINNRLSKLEKSNFIGEVYCCDEYGHILSVDCVPKTDPHYYPRFLNFTREDINDDVNGHIKINNTWFSKEDVILYDDIYKVKRDKIIKKYSSKENK